MRRTQVLDIAPSISRTLGRCTRHSSPSKSALSPSGYRSSNIPVPGSGREGKSQRQPISSLAQTPRALGNRDEVFPSVPLHALPVGSGEGWQPSLLSKGLTWNRTEIGYLTTTRVLSRLVRKKESVSGLIHRSAILLNDYWRRTKQNPNESFRRNDSFLGGGAMNPMYGEITLVSLDVMVSLVPSLRSSLRVNDPKAVNEAATGIADGMNTRGREGVLIGVGAGLMLVLLLVFQSFI